ncbi:tRNA (adenosine(37)-N6)-dimethylallyltransferase MiaA [Kordiimonas marina]|uniref:tRNA (adenosine(37)-N6)-dimethylallyltransferase MiaA n=1 Tax=Kordiimonas marina TaxID=2872312 RepID=UPI001FF2DE38|nr:tRNA (adenosine(37)-N6)-dimethylallyltransferase MiaA [Kordiimonas marina]MCJ9427472.1 tRNA (adenosine(37)-N6)-dimethylallyltransferase MiaA [Kordiimonas marina]
MKTAILIAGPTASGKSALSLRLAADTNGVIINADSMQVYRDLRVITARPSEEDEAKAPHKLYGFMDATEVCSAAFWAERAMAEIEAAWAEGLTPIVVGGTGMYFKVLLDGIAEIPEIPEDIRADVRARCDAEGSEVLHAELRTVDPVTADRLAPGDSQRISRALEVYKATGTPLSVWHKDTRPGPLKPLEEAGGLIKLVIDPPRDVLYDRCNRRFDLMLGEGGLDEVKALMARNLDVSLPVMRALGVPSLMAYLQGEVSLEGAVEDAKMQTRRFAKRQLTWFRNQFGAWDRVSAQLSESQYRDFLNKKIKKLID